VQRLSRTVPSILLYKGEMSDGNEASHLQKDKAPRFLNHCIHWKRVVGQLHGKVAWQQEESPPYTLDRKLFNSSASLDSWRPEKYLATAANRTRFLDDPIPNL